MRPKVVIGLLVLVGCVLTGVALLSNRWLSSSEDLGQPIVDLAANAAPVPGPREDGLPHPARKNTDQGTPMINRGADPQLGSLSASVDPDAAVTILAALEDPNRETRKAALDQAVQLDDRSLIPSLKAIAERTTDQLEKADILNAVEFINLPSVTEYLVAQQAQRAAAGQPDPPRTLTNRFTGRPFVHTPPEQ